MKKIYQEPSHAANFGAVNALQRASKDRIPKKMIQDWLNGTDSYTTRTGKKEVSDKSHNPVFDPSPMANRCR